MSRDWLMIQVYMIAFNSLLQSNFTGGGRPNIALTAYVLITLAEASSLTEVNIQQALHVVWFSV